MRSSFKVIRPSSSRWRIIVLGSSILPFRRSSLWSSWLRHSSRQELDIHHVAAHSSDTNAESNACASLLWAMLETGA